MRILSSERLLDLVALLMVGAAAASAPLGLWIKPSEFRAKSERMARLHQLQAMEDAQRATWRMTGVAPQATPAVTPISTLTLTRTSPATASAVVVADAR